MAIDGQIYQDALLQEIDAGAMCTSSRRSRAGDRPWPDESPPSSAPASARRSLPWCSHCGRPPLGLAQAAVDLQLVLAAMSPAA